MSDQAVRKGQCHAGIVGPQPGFKIERTAAGHLGLLRIAVARLELDGRAECVADRQPEQRAARAVNHFRRRVRISGGRHRRAGRPDTANISFLFSVLDRPWSCVAHPRDGFFRGHTKLDQQLRGDRPGAAEAAAAVQQNLAPGGEAGPQVRSSNAPSLFEGFFRHADIDHVMPRCRTASPSPPTL